MTDTPQEKSYTVEDKAEIAEKMREKRDEILAGETPKWVKTTQDANEYLSSQLGMGPKQIRKLLEGKGDDYSCAQAEKYLRGEKCYTLNVKSNASRSVPPLPLKDEIPQEELKKLVEAIRIYCFGHPERISSVLSSLGTTAYPNNISTTNKRRFVYPSYENDLPVNQQFVGAMLDRLDFPVGDGRMKNPSKIKAHIERERPNLLAAITLEQTENYRRWAERMGKWAAWLREGDDSEPDKKTGALRESLSKCYQNQPETLTKAADAIGLPERSLTSFISDVKQCTLAPETLLMLTESMLGRELTQKEFPNAARLLSALLPPAPSERMQASSLSGGGREGGMQLGGENEKGPDRASIEEIRRRLRQADDDDD